MNNFTSESRAGATRLGLRLSRQLAVVLTAMLVSTSAYPQAAYTTAARAATDWLADNVRLEGSWGALPETRYLQTSEAVLALAALNRREVAYYAGLTWLEGAAAGNVDYLGRRVLALQNNGNNILSDLSQLQAAQRLPAIGNGGWGLNPVYQGSTLDTALALQAYAQAGSSANVQPALDYLKASQLGGSDRGWAVAQEAVSDPATTAQVLLALMRFRTFDPTLATPIANGLAALNTRVNTASPTTLKALSALTNVRNSPGSATAATLLSNLVSTQSVNGSWGNDVYATALAIRAFAAALGLDTSDQLLNVTITDHALQSTINTVLGRNPLDALNRGEIGQLTTLDISGLGISSLNGLQYAVNLTFLDARNNNISDFGQVDGLTQATILRDGNPGAPPGAKVPLPLWNYVLLAGALLWLVHRRRQSQ
jgi:hypothetical protein